MAQFRKKPVIIEAIQWTGTNLFEIASFTSNKYYTKKSTGELMILTSEGEHIASANDWIIKGVKGEFYPCKPDIFEATYEKV